MIYVGSYQPAWSPGRQVEVFEATSKVDFNKALYSHEDLRGFLLVTEDSRYKIILWAGSTMHAQLLNNEQFIEDNYQGYKYMPALQWATYNNKGTIHVLITKGIGKENEAWFFKRFAKPPVIDGNFLEYYYADGPKDPQYQRS